MITIFIRTIKDRWRMLLAMCIIGVGSQLMYISLYPTFQSSQINYDDLMKQMPEAFKKVINMDSFSMDTIEQYLTMEMYSMFWLVLTIILTLSLAGSSLANDVERETIIQSASQPVSRTKIFFSRWLAAVSIYTAFNFVINAVVFPLCAVFNVDYLPSHFLAVGVMGELLGLALLSLAFAISAWLSDKGKVYMVMGGTVLIMYVLNIISSLKDNLANLKYISIFHYFDPNKALIQGQYDFSAIVVFLGIIVVSTLIGWWRWRTRDVV